MPIIRDPDSANGKTNYGVDAPTVIRNMYIVAIICFIIALAIPNIHFSAVQIEPSTFISMGICFIIPATLMLLYSLVGKYKYRDYMLNQVAWKGNEQVLDIGTGKGLLMIGAAKKMTTGKSFGIDIWNQEDLSGNNEANALSNAAIEGVSDKVKIENQNATKMSFPDAYFDVVISNLCLHNIYEKAGREQACSEIYRVLKPGGVAIISDYKHSSEYKAAFAAAGMRIDNSKTSWFSTFPPLTLVKAAKV